MVVSLARSLITKLRSSWVWRTVVATVAAAAVAVPLMLLAAPPASAHCDSKDGPVATAARDALDAGDVELILPYVKPVQEAELTMAFDQTTAIRGSGPEVQAVADQYFVETAVRLHRVGEGASYTGLKDEVETSPALAAAEASLERGTPERVIRVLKRDLRVEVTERFEGVQAARAAEQADPSVETARERVEAELAFEKYVLELGGAIDDEAVHEAEAAPVEGGRH